MQAEVHGEGRARRRGAGCRRAEAGRSERCGRGGEGGGTRRESVSAGLVVEWAAGGAYRLVVSSQLHLRVAKQAG